MMQMIDSESRESDEDLSESIDSDEVSKVYESEDDDSEEDDKDEGVQEIIEKRRH